MKLIFKILVSFILIILVGLGLLAIYNKSYESRMKRKLDQSGVKEKSFFLEGGSLIQYGEVKNDKPVLVLIHGQEVSWEDYVGVFDELSNDFHIYALDCYGHGGSSKNPEKYPIVKNARDMMTFIEEEVGEPVYLSGHSSGGLIASYIAGESPDLVKGLVIEDAPFFSTEKERAEKTFAGQGFKITHDYLDQTNEPYFLYYLENNYLKTLFNENGQDNWGKLVFEPAKNAWDKNPGKIPVLWYDLPIFKINEIYRLGACLQDGTGDYDLYYGDQFYDFSWFKDFSQEGTLKKIQCPSVLLHVAKPKGMDSYYDKNGVLLSAMDEKDAGRVHELLVDNTFIDEIEGSQHNIHKDRPEVFIQALKELKEKVEEGP